MGSVYSMTAYASHGQEVPPYLAEWEARSLNHRYLEISLRLPEKFHFLEMEVRQRVGEHLSRGKVSLSLKLQLLPSAPFELQVNEALVRALVAAIEQVQDHLPQAPPPQPVCPFDLLRWPGVVEEPELDRERIAEGLLEALEATLLKLKEMRAREGERIAGKLFPRLNELRQWVERGREIAPRQIEEVRKRLLERLGSLPVEAEQERLEQELLYYAQRLDVTEELDRLEIHLQEFENLLSRGGEPIGRRLDFLCQEMNREANTLGAKAAAAELKKVAIEIKVVVEQLREQVQNLE